MFASTDWNTAIPWNFTEGDLGTALIKGGSGIYSDENIVPLSAGVWLYVNTDGTLVGLAA